jgi:hypothetical protein
MTNSSGSHDYSTTLLTRCQHFFNTIPGPFPGPDSGIAELVEHYDATGHLTGEHRVERLVDLIQAESTTDELVDLDAPI